MFLLAPWSYTSIRKTFPLFVCIAFYVWIAFSVFQLDSKTMLKTLGGSCSDITTKICSADFSIMDGKSRKTDIKEYALECVSIGHQIQPHWKEFFYFYETMEADNFLFISLLWSLIFFDDENFIYNNFFIELCSLACLVPSLSPPSTASGTVWSCWEAPRFLRWTSLRPRPSSKLCLGVGTGSRAGRWLRNSWPDTQQCKALWKCFTNFFHVKNFKNIFNYVWN